MRKFTVGCLLVLCCSALIAGGCAKKEMVKKDESPATTVTPTKPTTPPAEKPGQTAPIKEETVSEQPIKGETLSKSDMAALQKADAEKRSLERIYFALDSFALSDDARETLYKNAEIMLKKPADKYRLEGHCDERGSDEYNLALGENRAKAALNYLVTLGVQPERLSFISYGEEKPLDQGHSEEAWAKNRRVEFIFIK